MLPTSPQYLTEGFEGTIRAEVHAIPRQKITWSVKKIIAELDKDGKMTDASPKKYQITRKGSLVITNVSSEDSGLYEVSASTFGARASKQITVYVGGK